MSLNLLTSPEDLAAYREYLKIASGASLWQSLEWKGYQEALGRETRLYGLRASSTPSTSSGSVQHDRLSSSFTATALVVIDKTAFGLSTWDIPRGPLGNDPATSEALLKAILKDARKERAMALYFSPPTSLQVFRFSFFVTKRKTSNPSTELRTSSQRTTMQRSLRREQPEASLVLDLTLPEEKLLEQMHPKGRYNIGVARKHSIQVEQSEDIDSFYALLQETSGRDHFGILPKNHYKHFLKDLPGSFLLLANPPPSREGTKNEKRKTKNSMPIAGLLGVIWNGRGYYYYGASDYTHRALMAPYALQWGAIRHCREKGCKTYDLLGIAPEMPGGQVSGVRCQVSHPWEGVTRFKKQFGGKIETYPPEQEIILRPVVKRMIEWKRKVWR